MSATLAGGPLRDRILAWRERITTDPRFRAWATRFPLTRPVARRRAARLFELCAGFVYSQVLMACVRLRLFEIVHEAPATEAALALRLALPTESLARLLAAAESLELLRRRTDGCWTLGKLGAAMIGNRGIAAMVDHHAMLYADLADPVGLLRRERGPTALSAYWAYSGAAEPEALAADRVAGYSALMAASQPMVAAEILGAYAFGRHAALLDVGGGEGAFLAAVSAQAPGLRLMLFDLPAVADRARRVLGPGAQCFGGDFTAEDLPAGADLISFVRVLHDHDDAVVRRLLRAARAALPPGGRVLIAEPMAGTPGAEAMGAAYFGFYLLAMGRGRPRRAHELNAMLIEAGFRDPRLLPTATPLLARVLIADVAIA